MEPKEGKRGVLVGAKGKVGKVGGEIPGTGVYYHRYLRLGGRPGKMAARTFTEPLPRLQRSLRRRLEPTIPAEQVMELKEDLKSIREMIQKLEMTG